MIYRAALCFLLYHTRYISGRDDGHLPGQRGVLPQRDHGPRRRIGQRGREFLQLGRRGRFAFGLGALRWAATGGRDTGRWQA